jgi:hypothetical protein
MDDRADKHFDLDLTGTAAMAMGGIERGEKAGLLLLLDTVDGALNELLKLEDELFEIIERQAERRAYLIKLERMSGIRDWLMSLSDPVEP